MFCYLLFDIMYSVFIVRSGVGADSPWCQKPDTHRGLSLRHLTPPIQRCLRYWKALVHAYSLYGDTTRMPHVLVIDDDPITAALVAGVADADWIVQAVPDGLVGLDRFRAHPTIALIVLDMEMPRLMATKRPRSCGQAVLTCGLCPPPPLPRMPTWWASCMNSVVRQSSRRGPPPRFCLANSVWRWTPRHRFNQVPSLLRTSV